MAEAKRPFIRWSDPIHLALMIPLNPPLSFILGISDLTEKEDYRYLDKEGRIGRYYTKEYKDDSVFMRDANFILNTIPYGFTHPARLIKYCRRLRRGQDVMYKPEEQREEVEKDPVSA